jgi:hypothetical protein
MAKHQSKQKGSKVVAAKTQQKYLKSCTRKKSATQKNLKCLKEPLAPLNQLEPKVNRAKKRKIFSLNFLPDGTVKSIYYDEFFGKNKNLIVERITDVEFDNSSQEWIARLISTKKIIARDKLRSKVLDEEVRIASKMIYDGCEIQPSKIKINENKKNKSK